MQKRLKIYEVGPRDGFQNVDEFIPTEIKLEIIDALVKSGLKNIQLTSFVSPKAVPQMRDAREICEYCLKAYKDTDFLALVPNHRGAQGASAAGLKEISVVISVSEGHNMANVRKTVDQSFGELSRILSDFPHLEVNLDGAAAFGCPYEGAVSYEKISEYIKRAAALGIKTVVLSDTIGVATPKMAREVFSRAMDDFSNINFRAHFHDTRGMGVASTLAAVESGVTMVESSVGGLGGCPFAPGASGNVATEDIVYMFNEMGYQAGVDFSLLMGAARTAREKVGGFFGGHQILIDLGRCRRQ